MRFTIYTSEMCFWSPFSKWIFMFLIFSNGSQQLCTNGVWMFALVWLYIQSVLTAGLHMHMQTPTHNRKTFTSSVSSVTWSTPSMYYCVVHQFTTNTHLIWQQWQVARLDRIKNRAESTADKWQLAVVNRSFLNSVEQILGIFRLFSHIKVNQWQKMWWTEGKRDRRNMSVHIKVRIKWLTCWCR